MSRLGGEREVLGAGSGEAGFYSFGRGVEHLSLLAGGRGPPGTIHKQLKRAHGELRSAEGYFKM
jgi:hypothetical protein